MPDGALHQRLDDQRGDRRVVRREVRVERLRGALGDVARRFARRGAARIRRGHGRIALEQRRVGVAENRARR